MSDKQPVRAAPARPPRKRFAGDEAEKSYFLVNPAGAIHSVSREHARERLKLAGWRLASQAEVDELRARSGHQRWDDPICAPWTPEPPLEPEVS